MIKDNQYDDNDRKSEDDMIYRQRDIYLSIVTSDLQYTCFQQDWVLILYPDFGKGDLEQSEKIVRSDDCDQ